MVVFRSVPALGRLRNMSDATPHHGILPFVLGMTRSQVLVAAGQPDKVETNDWGAGSLQTWSYDSMQVRVTFDEEEDWRMNSITIEGPANTIKGHSLIGCEADALELLAAEAGMPDVRQTDDFDENGKCHASELFDLQFWELGAKIVNVTLFPLYEEGGNVPRWPAA